MTAIPELKPVKSSNIEAIGYEHGELHVKFRNGGHYVYDGVPGSLHAGLLAADSKGAYLIEKIRGTFAHRKL